MNIVPAARVRSYSVQGPEATPVTPVTDAAPPPADARQMLLKAFDSALGQGVLHDEADRQDRTWLLEHLADTYLACVFGPHLDLTAVTEAEAAFVYAWPPEAWKALQLHAQARGGVDIASMSLSAHLCASEGRLRAGLNCLPGLMHVEEAGLGSLEPLHPSLPQQDMNSATPMPTTAERAALSRASLQRAIDEKMSPDTIRHLAGAAIEAHIYLMAPHNSDSAAHAQWCAETYDTWRPFATDRGFMGFLARRASVAFLDQFEMHRAPVLLNAFRAAKMDALALEFGAAKDPRFDSLARNARFATGDGSYSLSRESGLDSILSQTEIDFIKAGRFPWPDLGCSEEVLHATELARAAEKVDRFVEALKSSQGTLASLCKGLFDAIPAEHAHYFSSILRDSLRTELKAIQSSHADRGIREFARMAIDRLDNPRAPISELGLAMLDDCIGRRDFSNLNYCVLEKMFSAMPDDARERLMQPFDLGHLDRDDFPLASVWKNKVKWHFSQPRLARAEQLATLRHEEADAALTEGPLPPALANLVGPYIGRPGLAEIVEAHEAEALQTANDKKAITDFASGIGQPSDYHNDTLLLLYGRLFMGLAQTHSHPERIRRLQTMLGEQVANTRDERPYDPEVGSMLDEILALFSPALATRPHDLNALLLRAADGFIDTTSLSGFRNDKERFRTSWRVLLDRVNNCELKDKAQLRQRLLGKLMAFARAQPDKATWVRDALSWFTFEERYPLLSELGN